MAVKLTTSQVESINKVLKVAVKPTMLNVESTLKAFNSLTASIYATDFIETINLEDNPFDIFIKRDVKYGSGVRYVSTGIVESDEFKIGAYTPDLMGSKPVPDYEDFSSAFIKSVFPIIYNETEILDFFKNTDQFTQFLNKIRETNDKSAKSERLNMFLYILGNTTVNVPAWKKTELDKVKAKIVNTVSLGEIVDIKDLFKKVVKVAKDMGVKGTALSNKYNIGFAANSTDVSRKWNKSSIKNDLVLIVPYGDMNELSQEISTVYHQTFYQGENKFYAVIEADIPTGAWYVVDKESLRIDPKLEKSNAMVWMDMSTTITTNIWNYAGVMKYANGVKITYTLPTPTPTTKELTDSELENVKKQLKDLKESFKKLIETTKPKQLETTKKQIKELEDAKKEEDKGIEQNEESATTEKESQTEKEEDKGIEQNEESATTEKESQTEKKKFKKGIK